MVGHCTEVTRRPPLTLGKHGFCACPTLNRAFRWRLSLGGGS